MDPSVETWMLFTAVVVIYFALLLLRFCWLWLMKRFSRIFLKKKPLQFASYTIRELWLASFAGVRGAITLAGVLSVPLFLTDGSPFPARYQLVFIAAGVILFSIFAGVIALPLLLRNFAVGDKEADINEIRMAKAAMAEVAIVSLNKMEERLSSDVDEKLEPEDISEVASRVTGHLRRRTAGQDEIEHNLQIEDLERRFRLTALRAERGELYHLRATRKISNETLQTLLTDLDLLEAVLVDKEH